MKKNNDSLHWQNAQLYFFGVIFNFVNLTVQDIKAGFEKGSWILLLFHGYNFYTCLLVCTLSSSGLLVSWIMKYADSIVKVSQASKRAIDRSIDVKSMRSRLALLRHTQAPLPFPCIQPAHPRHPNLRSDTTSSLLSFPHLFVYASKVYATSMAMLVTMVVSIGLFGQTPTIQLLLGIFVATTSLQLYYMSADDLKLKDPAGSPQKLTSVVVAMDSGANKR